MGGSLEILKNVIFSNLVVYLGALLYGQLRENNFRAFLQVFKKTWRHFEQPLNVV